jgi:hypothetical protein
MKTNGKLTTFQKLCFGLLGGFCLLWLHFASVNWATVMLIPGMWGIGFMTGFWLANSRK